MYNHDVVDAGGHLLVGGGGQVRAADDDDAVAAGGQAVTAGPGVGVLDQFLGVAGRCAAQWRDAPVQAHFAKRLFFGAHANRGDEATLLRKR